MHFYFSFYQSTSQTLSILISYKPSYQRIALAFKDITQLEGCSLSKNQKRILFTMLMYALLSLEKRSYFQSNRSYNFLLWFNNTESPHQNKNTRSNMFRSNTFFIQVVSCLTRSDLLIMVPSITIIIYVPTTTDVLSWKVYMLFCVIGNLHICFLHYICYIHKK